MSWWNSEGICIAMIAGALIGLYTDSGVWALVGGGGIGCFYTILRKHFSNQDMPRKFKAWLMFVLVIILGVCGVYAYFTRAQQEISPSFYANRGFDKWGAGDLDGAIADYSKAIGLDPRDDTAYSGRALAESDKGDDDKAIADYTRVIELDPKDADAYFGRGVSENAKNYRDEAIADFTRVIELDPKNRQFAYTFRGDAKKAKGDAAGANADYNNASIELALIQKRLDEEAKAQ
jgi:tetratricopeptide (TPR) repeat protein